MEKEVLVILMVAFGLFAIVMFVLFFVYLKKYYNEKHLDDDYKKELDEEITQDVDASPSVVTVEPVPKVNQENISSVVAEVEEIEPVPLNVVEDIEPKKTLELDESDMDVIPVKKQ